MDRAEQERALTSPLWRCSACAKWIDHSDTSWRWTGRAWEHGHGQSGCFKARMFASVSEAFGSHADALSALSACVVAMRRWGADEDGVPEDAGDAIDAAERVLRTEVA